MKLDIFDIVRVFLELHWSNQYNHSKHNRVQRIDPRNSIHNNPCIGYLRLKFYLNLAHKDHQSIPTKWIDFVDSTVQFPGTAQTSSLCGEHTPLVSNLPRSSVHMNPPQEAMQKLRAIAAFQTSFKSCFLFFCVLSSRSQTRNVLWNRRVKSSTQILTNE